MQRNCATAPSLARLFVTVFWHTSHRVGGRQAGDLLYYEKLYIFCVVRTSFMRSCVDTAITTTGGTPWATTTAPPIFTVLAEGKQCPHGTLISSSAECQQACDLFGFVCFYGYTIVHKTQLQAVL